MAREFGRPQRVADFLRKEVSQLIQFQMRDPRVDMVSVTDVEVSRDLSHARFFITKLGAENKEDAKEALQVLNKAVGFLRSNIAKESTMRIVPTLRFYFDESIMRGQSLSALIDHAVHEDQQNHVHDESAESDDASSDE